MQRIWDDQSQARVQLETEAVQIILFHIEAGYLELVNSVALEHEVSQVPDDTHRQLSQSIISQAKVFVALDDIIEKRVNELKNLGFKGWDTFHAAIAELQTAKLITTDDRLLKKLKTITWNSEAFNPVNFVQEKPRDR